MKALFFLDELIIGGALVNAIEIAATLRYRHRWDVVLYAAPGPMVKVAEERGVRVVLAPLPLAHPSPKRMRALHEVVVLERPDLICAWEPMPRAVPAPCTCTPAGGRDRCALRTAPATEVMPIAAQTPATRQKSSSRLDMSGGARPRAARERDRGDDPDRGQRDGEHDHRAVDADQRP